MFFKGEERLYGNLGVNDAPSLTNEEFIEYYNKQTKVEFEGIVEQFGRIPLTTIHSTKEAEKTSNKSKNRYCDIVPYDHSRVKLQSKRYDYINANYIHDPFGKVRYIAAQAPINDTINDFLIMIIEQKIPAVVMLTNLVENGKNKSAHYWPKKTSQNFHGITVEILNIEQNADFIIRTLRLKKDGSYHNVEHFQFTLWPDHGCPLYATMLLGFHRRFRQIITFEEPSPILVHCSAGIGRTGTFILIDAMMHLAERKNKIDVYSYFEIIRQDRMKMIQTAEQYIFVYNAIYESLCCGNTSVKTENFQAVLTNMLTSKSNDGKSAMEEEFSKLQDVISRERAKSVVTDVRKDREGNVLFVSRRQDCRNS